MADDKKNIPEAAPPAEAPAPTVENAVVPEQPAPEPALTDAEVVMLEHEGQAALFEMGEAVPDPADAVTHAEVEEPAAPEVPKAEKEQPPAPGKDAPAPAHSGKVVDFAAARDEAAKEEKKAVKQKPPTEKNKAVKPGRGRPPKESKAAPDKAKPSKPRDKKSQSKPAPEKSAVDKGGAPAGAEVTPEPFVPRDATRAEKEEIVYLSLSDLHPFKNHPFGVRDDAEMQGLVESVKAAGVNQPALVRPREDGGEVPEEQEKLESLPGVGHKTANVLRNVWFGKPTMAVDTHVFRIAHRLDFSQGKTVEAVEKDLLKALPEKYLMYANHWLVLFGRYVCKAQKPKCTECLLAQFCRSEDKNI